MVVELNCLAYCVTLAMLDLLTLLANIRLSLNSCRDERSSLLLCNVNVGSIDHTRKYWTKLKMVAGTNGLAYCSVVSMLESYLLILPANIRLS